MPRRFATCWPPQPATSTDGAHRGLLRRAARARRAGAGSVRDGRRPRPRHHRGAGSRARGGGCRRRGDRRALLGSDGGGAHHPARQRAGAGLGRLAAAGARAGEDAAPPGGAAARPDGLRQLVPHHGRAPLRRGLARGGRGRRDLRGHAPRGRRALPQRARALRRRRHPAGRSHHDARAARHAGPADAGLPLLRVAHGRDRGAPRARPGHRGAGAPRA